MPFKLTKEEKNWILYDVGNSAFVLIISTIIPIYFNYLAGSAGLSDVEYLAYWGYTASAATLVVALMGPICGTLADTKGYKKPIFIISLMIGAVSQLTGDINKGVGMLSLMFVIGILIFRCAVKED